LILLLLALAVDYAENTLIGALGPTLEHTFHFGNTALGVLAAASSIVTAIATLPLGVLTDRVKRTLLLAGSLVVWAIAVGVAGASLSFAMFFAARLGLGAVDAVMGPATPSLTGDLVLGRQRARALGFIDSGQLVGTGVGLWLGALGYIIAPLPLFFAFRAHTLLVALPLFVVGAFFVAGAGPPLDAVRGDVIVPRLRGRAEAIRQVLRTILEGAAPLLIGVLSGVLAGGRTAGLREAFLLTLPFLALSGLVLLIALRTYAPDIAAALASTEREASGRDADAHAHAGR